MHEDDSRLCAANCFALDHGGRHCLYAEFVGPRPGSIDLLFACVRQQIRAHRLFVEGMRGGYCGKCVERTDVASFGK
nr:hypothetical protein [Paraburkholderia kirstenboschensis]